MAPYRHFADKETPLAAVAEYGFSQLTARLTAAAVAAADPRAALGALGVAYAITPDGKRAILNNIGGGQDGQVDTVGIIDLEASPPRVIDQVVVGDGPEGLAVSPTGGYAASLILNGTGGAPRTAFYRHEKSYVAPQDRGKDCAQGGAD